MPGWVTSQRGYPIFARRLRGLDQESQLSQEAVNFHAPFAASVIYHRKSRGKEKEREIADSLNQVYDVKSVWVEHMGTTRITMLNPHVARNKYTHLCAAGNKISWPNYSS